MTWDDFIRFQRWDEFPEKKDDPPMTADFSFTFRGKKYYCTGEDYGNVIVDEQWNRLAYDTNLLKLLEEPLLEGKSFRELIEELDIE